MSNSMQNAAAGLFRSERLIYRAPETSDDDYFFGVQNDSLVMANMFPGITKPRDRRALEDQRKWFDSCMLVVMICLPPASPTDDTSTTDGKPPQPVPIGHISLSGEDGRFAHHRRSQIGLTISPQYQNKGYGSEAIEWILNWGFQIAGLHRIAIGAFGWNEGARRLYERMGFVPEARKRDYLWFNGGWYDLYEFAMLEQEWRERRMVSAAKKERAETEAVAGGVDERRM